MSPLVPLHVFHTPNMESQCKLICRSGGRRGANFASGPLRPPAQSISVVTHLKRLLQYLQGSVLGFWFRFSPFSSAVRGGMASIDCWRLIMSVRRLSLRWGISQRDRTGTR